PFSGSSPQGHFCWVLRSRPPLLIPSALRYCYETCGDILRLDSRSSSLPWPTLRGCRRCYVPGGADPRGRVQSWTINDFPVSVTRYRTRLYEHYRSGLGLAAVSSEADSTKYILRRLLRGYVPNDRAAPILDLGCGSGMLVHLLRQAGYQNAVGVDTSVEQVAGAKAA